MLGHLPDEGERLALGFLNGLCERIAQVYSPGARILICSDGHVFGDLIRVPDRDIDAYSDELAAMIDREGLQHLATFDMRDVLGDLPYDDKRALVHARFAPSLEDLRAEVRSDEETNSLYRGITRFLVDDTADFTGTRSALQRECRRRAYGVIQRSRAWGTLIAEQHPVRSGCPSTRSRSAPASSASGCWTTGTCGPRRGTPRSCTGPTASGS